MLQVIQHSSLSKSLLHLEVASMEAKPDHLVRLRTQFYMNRMEEPIHKKEIELVIKTAIEDMPILDFHFLSQNLSFSLINPNNISEVFSPAFLKTVKAKRWALNFGPFYYALKVFGITVVIMIFIGIGAFCQSLKTSKEAKIRQAREEVAKLFQFIAQAQVLEEAQLKGDRLALSLPLLKEEVTQRRFTLQCAAQLAQRNYTHFRNGVDNKAFSTDPTAKDEPKAQAIIEMKDMTKSVRTDQAKQVEDRTGMIDTWVSQTVKSTTGHEIDAHYEETSFIEGDVQGTSTKVKGIKASKKKVNAMQTVAMVH